MSKTRQRLTGPIHSCAALAISLVQAIGQSNPKAATPAVTASYFGGIMHWGIPLFRRRLMNLIRETLKEFNIGVTKYSHLQLLEAHSQSQHAVEFAVDDIDFLLALPVRHTTQLLESMRSSRSQLHQDLFVLSELDFKKGGFFVEFGATDGVDLSNTCLLEREFGWSGILAEPARRWHEDLMKNRRCHIETDCVWRDSNSILAFNEVKVGELSTIEMFSSSDLHRQERINGQIYSVKTVSLEDLLKKYKAPPTIDYLSIDTEGSEYEIMSNFNFEKFQFRVITVEHNFEPRRDRIFKLLTKKGYARKLEGLSKFDDWYVRSE